MSKYIYLTLGLITGCLGTITSYELLKDRNFNELKDFSNYINVDITGFLENNEFYNKKRNFWNLILYSLNLPKQYAIKVKSNKLKS